MTEKVKEGRADGVQRLFRTDTMLAFLPVSTAHTPYLREWREGDEEKKRKERGKRKDHAKSRRGLKSKEG